ncbi:hypothetical protein V6N13_135322 [Hibiscus sabdariffa]
MKTSFSSTLVDRIYHYDGTKNEAFFDHPCFFLYPKRETMKTSFSSTLLDRIYHYDGTKNEAPLRSHLIQVLGFFSSLSSSDTKFMHCTKTRASSCFVQPCPRPVETRVLAVTQSDKSLKIEQRVAEKIHDNLKKMKQRQPISPTIIRMKGTSLEGEWRQ